MILKKPESRAPTGKEAVESIARRTGKPESEVLREAIALQTVAQDAWEKGGKVIIETRDGKRYEVPRR